MKRINLLLVGLACLFVVTSCNKEPELPFDTFEDLEYGAYARLLSFSGGFFLTDIEGSALSFDVEFYDENQGQNVESYTWNVAFERRDAEGALLESAGPAQLVSISSSSFGTSTDGLPSTTVSSTFPQVLDALGLSASDVQVGDNFIFNGTVRKTDGREFSAANTGANVISSAPFSGWFVFNLKAACPSELGGTHSCTSEAWCGETATVDVTFTEAEGPGVFAIDDFSLGTYLACYGGGFYPDGDLRFNDICNQVSVTGASQWGEIYTFNSLTVNGAEMILDWENDYGEAGVSTITRGDGADWPPLSL